MPPTWAPTQGCLNSGPYGGCASMNHVDSCLAACAAMGRAGCCAAAPFPGDRACRFYPTGIETAFSDKWYYSQMHSAPMSGGGGGGGWWGGGGGAGGPTASGGGGGGSGWNPSGTLIAGAGVNPPRTGDCDYGADAARGGSVASAGLGVGGRVVIYFTPVVPSPMCGDGKLDAEEECDDGNPEDDDGCSAGCVVERGYRCTNPFPDQPSQCTRCGVPAKISLRINAVAEGDGECCSVYHPLGGGGTLEYSLALGKGRFNVTVLSVTAHRCARALACRAPPKTGHSLRGCSLLGGGGISRQGKLVGGDFVFRIWCRNPPPPPEPKAVVGQPTAV